MTLNIEKFYPALSVISKQANFRLPEAMNESDDSIPENMQACTGRVWPGDIDNKRFGASMNNF